MNGGSNEIDIDEVLRNLQRYLPQIVLGLLLVLAAMGLFSTFYQVEPHERAVVLRFGKYHATTQPGLHFRIPLVDTVLSWGGLEHWIIHGLTIRNGGFIQILGASNDVIVDYNLIENGTTFGVRIGDGKSSCVQRNVIRNYTGVGDQPGIYVKPFDGDDAGA